VAIDQFNLKMVVLGQTLAEPNFGNNKHNRTSMVIALMLHCRYVGVTRRRVWMTRENFSDRSAGGCVMMRRQVSAGRFSFHQH